MRHMLGCVVRVLVMAGLLVGGFPANAGADPLGPAVPPGVTITRLPSFH